MMVIHSAVNGTSCSGVTSVPKNVSHRWTRSGPSLYGERIFNAERTRKAPSSRGKAPDLVVLSANPMTVDDATIKDIKVLQTIKDGKKIYDAVAMTRALVAECAAQSVALNKPPWVDAAFVETECLMKS